MGLISKTWSQYADETTIHGIPDIQKANSIVKVIFWLLVFITCFGLAIWEIIMVFEDYKASPIITTYDLISEEGMELPPIQICPINFVSKAKVSQIRLAPVIVSYALTALPDYSVQLVQFEEWAMGSKLYKAPIAFAKAALQPNRVKAFEVAKRTGRLIGLTDEQILVGFARLEAEIADTVSMPYKVKTAAHDLVAAVYNQNIFGGLIAREKLIGPQPVDYFHQHFKTAQDYAVDPTTKEIDIEKIFESVSFNPEEMFILCWIGVKHVPWCEGLVETVFDQRFGRCFLVKIGLKQMIAGLAVQIWMNTRMADVWNDVYIPLGGIKVRVEKPYNPTSVNVFAIPIGYQAFIRLQKTHYLLTQSEKYGRCQRDMPRKFTTYPYSDNSCRAECVLKASYGRCGCLNIVAKQFRKPGTNYPYCSENGDVLSNYLCLGNYTDEGDAIDIACVKACKPSCEYSDFAPVLSFNALSNQVDKSHFAIYRGAATAEASHKNLMANEVRLDVAYAAMEYMKVEQKDAISVHGLISQVGGQLGLFLGASAISFFQIAAIFIFCPCRHQKRKGLPKVGDAEAQIYPIENKNDQLHMPQIH